MWEFYNKHRKEFVCEMREAETPYNRRLIRKLSEEVLSGKLTPMEADLLLSKGSLLKKDREYVKKLLYKNKSKNIYELSESMKLNLKKIKDGFRGESWHHIYTANFDFLRRIKDISSHKVNIDDILIHKDIKDDQRFPNIIYYLITEKGPAEIKKNEVRWFLARKLIDYIKEHNKFPYGCTIERVSKKGNALVKYTPTQFDIFTLTLHHKVHGIKNAEGFFKSLKK